MLFVFFRLTLFEGTKSDLAGFYDPTPSAALAEGGHGVLASEEEEDGRDRKELLVLYLYQGARHRVLAGDAEALRMPRNAHRILTTSS